MGIIEEQLYILIHRDVRKDAESLTATEIEDIVTWKMEEMAHSIYKDYYDKAYHQ